MKVTIKINDSEVILEAEEPDEFAALGPLALSILEGAGRSAQTSEIQSRGRNGSDSEVSQHRLSAVAWVLSTNHHPMNAPEVAIGVRGEPSFYTKSGDPIHIVRRVLAEGVQSGVFLKTTGGLFTTPPDELDEETIRAVTVEAVLSTLASTRPSLAPIPAHLKRPSAEDDMDDPFADN